MSHRDPVLVQWLDRSVLLTGTGVGPKLAGRRVDVVLTAVGSLGQPAAGPHPHGTTPPQPSPIQTDREIEVLRLTWILVVTTKRVVIRGSFGGLKREAPIETITRFYKRSEGVMLEFTDGTSLKIPTGVLYQNRALRALSQVTGRNVG
jgi:hypothetical protein